MKLSILSVAFPFAAVRNNTAGGAEQVLAMIDEALVEAGHNSVVIASEGSEVKGKLIRIPRLHSSITPELTEFIEEQQLIAIEQALARWEIDLIHMHGLDFSKYLPSTEIRVLVTLHLPLSWYPHEELTSERKGVYYNCVSASQFESRPDMPSLLGYISNGVKLKDYELSVNKRNYALSLGRICREKGYHISLEAAKKAGIPLVIAGELFPYDYHREYYEKEILPGLDGENYSFIGPADTEKKKQLLAGAKCLLVPSLVPETSSLVAMEALASGTPVIAYPAGALTEIIEHGKTGFIVNSVDEMAGAIKMAGTISPELCRETARGRFSSERMIREYFELYEALIKKSPSEEASDGSSNSRVLND